MQLRTAVLALFSVSLATAGQLLLKAGMARVGYIGGARLNKPFALVMQIATTWQVVLGFALFVASSVFWILVLSRVPLSFAYPFVGLTYVMITLFGKFVLHEHVPNLRWAGLALIICGILVVGRTAPPEPAGADTASRPATTAVAP
ncbi:MAG TPA: EamA family transporter [Actinomycetota bacterium]|nr:EamA family transporter [Actinomycetota bacterium]